MNALKSVRTGLSKPGANACALVEAEEKRIRNEIVSGRKASSLSADSEYAKRAAGGVLLDMDVMLRGASPADGKAAFALLKGEFDKRTGALKTQAADAGRKLSNAFAFCEAVFGGDSQEILIFVTEMTISYYGARFISRYGCKEYFAHNKELLFYERQKEIISQIEKLELD